MEVVRLEKRGPRGGKGAGDGNGSLVEEGRKRREAEGSSWGQAHTPVAPTLWNRVGLLGDRMLRGQAASAPSREVLYLYFFFLESFVMLMLRQNEQNRD